MSLAQVPSAQAPFTERGSAGPSGPGTDEELVARIAHGDREAFAELYDRYEAVLLPLAQRLLRSLSDAEDLVHDVCLEIWRHAHTYERSRGTVRTWMVMRLRSRALDRIRSAGRLQLEAPESKTEEPAAPGMDPALRSDCSRVQRALSALPEEQRSVLMLAYFEGLPLPEISERLSIPVGTAKSRLSRALGKLREDLDA